MRLERGPLSAAVAAGLGLVAAAVAYLRGRRAGRGEALTDDAARYLAQHDWFDARFG